MPKENENPVEKDAEGDVVLNDAPSIESTKENKSPEAKEKEAREKAREAKRAKQIAKAALRIQVRPFYSTIQ